MSGSRLLPTSKVARRRADDGHAGRYRIADRATQTSQVFDVLGDCAITCGSLSWHATAEQADTHADGVGDASDGDDDGVLDDIDNCSEVSNADQASFDGDATT